MSHHQHGMLHCIAEPADLRRYPVEEVCEHCNKHCLIYCNINFALIKAFYTFSGESVTISQPDCVRQLAAGKNAAERVPESGFAEEFSGKT